jgi:peptidoglycan hydrolase FlgJ
MPAIGQVESKLPANPGASADSRNKIRQSAKQFEALLIGQIMRTMRASSGGWLGSGEDQASESMSEFAEQQMAQDLSSNGGFGLASLIEQGLSRDGQRKTSEGAVSSAE